METGKTKIRVSVRNLVEFILRSGDIDNRRSGAAQKDAMQEGSRLHRKIQRMEGADYHAEVPLKYFMEGERYDLCIEGRADGIIINNDGVVIDEIKGIYQDPYLMEEPIPVHLAQAKCYAFIYGKQNFTEKIVVQMTYCNMDTEKIRRFLQEYTLEELTNWFRNLVEEYRKWTDFQFDWRNIRQESIQGLEFPYPYREGQKKLVSDVYRTIHRRKNLFIQAPTGVGKTMCTVFPAVKAVGEELGEKIFYLTAKTITRTVAWEAFETLADRGYQGKIISLTAKEKMCFCDEMNCNPVDCPYAKGHYDRVNDAVFELITAENRFSREVLCRYAEKHQVCPFEMGLDVSLWCDGIICDYNYVFDPNVYLKRFFEDGVKGDYIFLVDEAHNLVERGREMYSATLYKEDFLRMKKIVEPLSKKLYRQFEKCNKMLLDYKRECETYQEYDSIGGFIFQLMQLAALMEDFSNDHPDFEGRKEWGEFYLELRHFMNMYDIFDENYTVYTEHEPDGRFKLKLLCVNTAKVMEGRIGKANSTIFFSATLLPIQYYKNMLSTNPDNYAVYAESAFKNEQRLILIGRDVSSKYTKRGAEQYKRIAEYIMRTAAAKKGNYLVFFPSYQFKEEVSCIFSETYGEQFEVLEQGRGMSEQDKEEFLAAFDGGGEKSLIGFTVMGGIFAEGIDLTGDRLIGTIIVGTGLPQISNERDILKHAFDRKNESGFDYAYRYPGMNKVEQAAGRVIRTVTDKGVIVLLDERFLQQDYLKMFPREWADYRVCDLSRVDAMLNEFWSVKGEP